MGGGIIATSHFFLHPLGASSLRLPQRSATRYNILQIVIQIETIAMRHPKRVSFLLNITLKRDFIIGWKSNAEC